MVARLGEIIEKVQQRQIADGPTLVQVVILERHEMMDLLARTVLE